MNPPPGPSRAVDRISIVVADITTLDVDAIVNAANSEKAVLLAREHGLRSIVFPCISTGVYGYPISAAARVAVRAIVRALTGQPLPEQVILCAFDPAAARALASALQSAIAGVAGGPLLCAHSLSDHCRTRHPPPPRYISQRGDPVPGS